MSVESEKKAISAFNEYAVEVEAEFVNFSNMYIKPLLNYYLRNNGTQ